ncbi:MAG TPA: hypothetical protein PKN44_14405, partial [Bacteroidales bacterium]|nr:hypothetical protein [Bacteroidales bacterium]
GDHEEGRRPSSTPSGVTKIKQNPAFSPGDHEEGRRPSSTPSGVTKKSATYNDVWEWLFYLSQTFSQR